MTLEERSTLVLAFARLLYVNGQSTDQTLAAAERYGETLGLRAQITPSWAELQLQAEDGSREKMGSQAISSGLLTCSVRANPTGVNMNRVVSARRIIEQATATMEAISSIAQAPPAPAWLFTLAAGACAVALGVLFGVSHLSAAVLIFVSAAAGAILRRGLVRYSANVFLQPFCAALLAGVNGALAVRYELSSSFATDGGLPVHDPGSGPHILNSALDFIKGRVDLGAVRLSYAGLVIVAIATGLLLGLGLLGVSLLVGQAGQALPLWQDMIAAGGCRCLLQHLFLHAAPDATLARNSGDAGPCCKVVGP